MIFGISLSLAAGFVLGGFFYHPLVDNAVLWIKHAVDVTHTAAKGPKK